MITRAALIGLAGVPGQKMLRRKKTSPCQMACTTCTCQSLVPVHTPASINHVTCFVSDRDSWPRWCHHLLNPTLTAAESCMQANVYDRLGSHRQCCSIPLAHCPCLGAAQCATQLSHSLSGRCQCCCGWHMGLHAERSALPAVLGQQPDTVHQHINICGHALQARTPDAAPVERGAGGATQQVPGVPPTSTSRI